METAICLVMALFVCLGYNHLFFDVVLPNGIPGKLVLPDGREIPFSNNIEQQI